jgi:uncharacterized membrane protein YccC
LSVGLTATLIAVLAASMGLPVTELAFGVVLSMVGPFVMRDLTSRQRQMTLLLLLPPAATAIVATSLLHAHPPAGELWFLGLVFVGTLLRARHPRALGMGLIAMIMTYVGLYLRLSPATLPLQLLSLCIGAASVWFVCLVLVPLRPVLTLRRAVRAVRRRAARVLREIGQGTDPQRLRRHLLRLNEAALAAEDQLVLLDEPSQVKLRLHLFGLEQTVTRLMAEVTPGGVQQHLRDRLHLAAERLRRSKGGRPRLRTGIATDPMHDALLDLTHASASLEQAAVRAMAGTGRAVAVPVVPGPLAWRSAVQVTLAALAAMLGGMALAPERWFWAVITVYIVFLNTRTRGDTIYRALHRISGTLIGLFGGLALATFVAGHVMSECIIMLAAIFGIYYFYVVSYAIAIFFVTVLLGMVYGVLGISIEQILFLRLEETAVGVLAAGLAATFVWPIPTRHQVRLSGQAVLRSLQDVVQDSVAAMREAGNGGPIDAVRRLDRQIADLRLALLPLTAGRFVMRRARVDRPVTALLACAEAARMLVAAVGAPGDDLEGISRQAEEVSARIVSMLDGTPMTGVSGVVAVGQAGQALSRLNLSLAMLSERLQANLLDGFAVE